MAASVLESPGQPPGISRIEKPLVEEKQNQETMDTNGKGKTNILTPEDKDPAISCKRKQLSNEPEEDDKLESLDDICRKKFKPIAPKPFLKKDHHQSLVMTAMPVKESSDKTVSSVESDSPTKGPVIFMGPNMQLYPSAPFIVQPPPLVPCSGTVLPPVGSFSFAMPTPVGHFVPQVAHMPGFCPSGQYHTCCVRFPPPVVEGRDYFVNGVRPLGHKPSKEDTTKTSENPLGKSAGSKNKTQSSSTICTKDSIKSKASRYKYSILYNGPIYKGATPLSQQNITATPQVENCVPITESDNAGNIKLSLPAMLTSTGVLQITVPRLSTIDPKQTTNPSAFPQIKLQTVHGAVLTPGVLPTVLSPQHHPNSGHVVVVSAHNQVNASKHVPASRAIVCNSVAPTLNVRSRSDVTISKSSMLNVNTLSSGQSISSDNNHALVVSRSLANSSHTSSTSSTSVPVSHCQQSIENNTGNAGSSDQSLRNILTCAGNVSTTESAKVPPTMTVPNTVNTASVRNLVHPSSVTKVSTLGRTAVNETAIRSSLGNSHFTSRTSASMIQRNTAIETNNVNPLGGTVLNRITMNSAVGSLPTSVTDNGSQNTESRTNTLSLANLHSNKILTVSKAIHKDTTSTSSYQCNLESIETGVMQSSGDDTHQNTENNRSSQNMTNHGSDTVSRWPQSTHETMSYSQRQSGVISGPNLEDHLRTSGQILDNVRLQRSTIMPVTTAASPPTATPTVSKSSNHLLSPRTVSISETQNISCTASTAESTHSQTVLPIGQKNRTAPAINIHGTTSISMQKNTTNHCQNINSSGHGHAQHQRLPDTISSTHCPNQQVSVASLLASRTIRESAPADSPDHNRSDHATSDNIRSHHTRLDHNRSHHTRPDPTSIQHISNSTGNESAPTDNTTNLTDMNGNTLNSKQQALTIPNPSTPARIPLSNQQMSSAVKTVSRHQFPSQTQQIRPALPPSNVIPKYTSSVASQPDSSAPPVVCVTPHNKFVRPASSSHSWPQTPGDTHTSSHSQIRPTPSISTANPQTTANGNYTSSVQLSQRNLHSRNYPSIQPSEINQSGQLRTPPERSLTSMGQRYDEASHNIPQRSRFSAMQSSKSTSRPWQTTSITCGMANPYSGLGLRERSLSTGQLPESEEFIGNSMNQSTDRFGTQTLVNTDHDNNSSQIQTVPLHSNVPANTRQAMTDVIHRRCTRPQQRRQTQSSNSSKQSGSHSETNMNTEQESPLNSDNAASFASTVMSSEHSQSSTVRTTYSTANLIAHERTMPSITTNSIGQRCTTPHLTANSIGQRCTTPHITSSPIGHGSNMLYSDSISRLPVPIVHPMLYGNSTPVSNLPGMSGLHSMPLTGALGGHSMQRHNVAQHSMTPPPTHHTPPRPGPHGHSHMFVPPPYASMHRPLYIPAPSPRPPDLGLISPRGYSHVHDSGLYSPRFQSMQNLQSSSSLADSILTSHLARTFSDDRLDTCCSGLLAHSPPARNNNRPILSNAFSPHIPSVSYGLSVPTTTPNTNAVSQGSNYQERPQTAMPSDIFGPSHLESIGLSAMSSASTTPSSTRTCVQSSPTSVPSPLTVLTNLNTMSNTHASNLHSDSTSVSTSSSHISPPISSPSSTSSNPSLPARVFIGNTSDKYLPLEQVPTPPTTTSTVSITSTNQLNSDQVVKFGEAVLKCSRQILRESGRTVLCCWHCDYHTAEPKKMYRHQHKDNKVMKCQLCDFKGYSRCTINQHFKEQHMDKT